MKRTESIDLRGPVCPRCGDPRTMQHRRKNGQWFQQCKHCKYMWDAPPPKFFQGEMMHCVMCDREQQSDPKVTSDWTVLEMDQQPFYCCPDCLQKNAKDIASRYQAVIEKILSLIQTKGRPA